MIEIQELPAELVAPTGLVVMAEEVEVPVGLAVQATVDLHHHQAFVVILVLAILVLEELTHHPDRVVHRGQDS